MNKFMTSIFGTNWRTAITGYAGAIFTACLPYLQKGNFNLKTDYPYLIGAVGVALFGNVSKDAKVSGLPDGTYNTPAEPSQALIDAEAALAAAKSTNNPTLIKIAQGAVDELNK